MIILLLATLISAGFSLSMRFAQTRNCNLVTVGAVNYAVATLFQLILALAAGWPQISRPTAVIGVLGGTAFVTAFFFFFSFMAVRGVSVTTTVIRLSVLVPLVFSLAVWGERAGILQTVGGLVALVSLPLLSMRPGKAKAIRGRGAAWHLLTLLAVNGLCILSIRWYHQTGIKGEEAVFLFFLFGTAALWAWTIWLFRRKGTSLRDVLPGVAMGLCNGVSNRLIVASLERLPSVIVYPFLSSVGLVSTILVARIVWKEKLTGLELSGISLTLAAVILVNLGR